MNGEGWICKRPGWNLGYVKGAQFVVATVLVGARFAPEVGRHGRELQVIELVAAPLEDYSL